LTFSSEQLRQVGQTISEEFSLRGSGATVPELVLMPVDPYHLHAYWHIDAGDTPAVQKGQQPGGKSDLRLRIFCQYKAQPGQSNSEPWFDVAVGTERNWCDVRLPLDNLRCRAALGIKSDNQPFAPLLFSNRVQAPKAGPSAVRTAAAERLKGAQLDRPTAPSDRPTASAASNRYDERLIDAIIRQALSDQNIRVKLKPQADREQDCKTEQTLIAPALSSHTIARRHIE
jgi:hypothetical protein